jgi:hypothetical protein
MAEGFMRHVTATFLLFATLTCAPPSDDTATTDGARDDAGDRTDSDHGPDDSAERDEAASDAEPEVPADVAADDTVEPDVPVGLPDDARLVDLYFPVAIHPGESGRINIWLANVGTATWTPPAYWLAAVDGSDPFFAPRFDLPDGTAVPGDPAGASVYRFILYVFAPADVGSYLSDWQLTHDGVGSFGPVVSDMVEVVPDPALCPAPVPPPLDRFNVVIHNDMGWHKVLDSTPLVWADGGVFCADIGFTDGRRACPPRPEGHPEVAVCNEQLVGYAADTGRVGPTWTYNYLPCVDVATEGRCRNHTDNQFLVHVYGPGIGRACGRNGVCGEVVVP